MADESIKGEWDGNVPEKYRWEQTIVRTSDVPLNETGSPRRFPEE